VFQGSAVAISADGSTAISGGYEDSDSGAAWIFTRSNGSWIQQGPKLTGAGPGYEIGFGSSVAISADGNTALVGGPSDNSGVGALWVFTRANDVWSQQGDKLGGSGAKSFFGSPVALSADGNTAVAGGSAIPLSLESTGVGAALWVFTRSNGVWSQQGGLLTLSGLGSDFTQIGISGDGNTIIAGGGGVTFLSNGGGSAALIFTRTNGVWSQQGGSLIGSDTVGLGYAWSVALSGDGNTALVGDPTDNHSAGAAWVFVRSNGVWTQQGSKLTAPHAPGFPGPGGTASLSADGNTALSAGFLFTRNSSGVWSLSGTLSFGGGALSADASTVLVGDPYSNNNVGEALVLKVPQAAAVGVTPPAGSSAAQTFSFTFSDAGGWQNLKVVDILINSALDAQQACYVAFVPSGAASGSVLLVDNSGDVAGPYFAMTLPGSGAVDNNLCTITAAGSSVFSSGNTLTLTLSIAFSPSFGGNRVIYLAAQDAQATSGWQALGTWSVPGPVAGPAVEGMSPARSTGAAQTYTFAFTDGAGWQDIGVTNILIHSALDGSNACYVAFAPAGAATGALYLVDNAGDAAGPFQGMMLPGSGSVSNAQCAMAAAGSYASAVGTALTLTLAITFSHSFAGNQVIYAAARGGAGNSGWQSVGTVSVP